MLADKDRWQKLHFLSFSGMTIGKLKSSDLKSLKKNRLAPFVCASKLETTFSLFFRSSMVMKNFVSIKQETFSHRQRLERIFPFIHVNSRISLYIEWSLEEDAVVSDLLDSTVSRTVIYFQKSEALLQPTFVKYSKAESHS